MSSACGHCLCKLGIAVKMLLLGWAGPDVLTMPALNSTCAFADNCAAIAARTCAEAEGIVVEGWQADSDASSVRASVLTFAQGFATGERARLASWRQHVALGEIVLLKFAFLLMT